MHNIYLIRSLESKLEQQDFSWDFNNELMNSLWTGPMAQGQVDQPTSSSDQGCNLTNLALQQVSSGHIITLLFHQVYNDRSLTLQSISMG